MLSPIEEIRFWTGIMRDHGEFMLSSFSYNEKEAIYYANYYKEAFSKLHERSMQYNSTNDINTLKPFLQECLYLLKDYINFKKLLLKRHLECNLKTSLPPTFYNHMINEAMDFYKTICKLLCNCIQNPVFGNLELHRTWLPDAAGHAATIACQLDPIEKLLINEVQEFEKCFNNLTIKADELSKMLMRTCLTNGALELLNDEACRKISEFICYLFKIKNLRTGCKALGTLNPLVPDHMIREEDYYMRNFLSFCKR